jgi:hypothetical protein
MRVCISYTHPYPIKSLNHTLPFRICKLCFQANMQVASTLWPDIKSQKLSEHRFRLRWTKSEARTQFKTSQDRPTPTWIDKEAQYSLPGEDGGGWWPGQADRPTWSADQARGPHCLNQGTWHLPVGPLRRLCRLHPVAPFYKYKGGGEYDTHTHTNTHTPHTSHLLSCIPCIVFRLSGV